MKKRLFLIMLLMCLVLSREVPSLADCLDGAENGLIIEQQSVLNENPDAPVLIDEDAFSKPDDNYSYSDEENGAAKEAASGYLGEQNEKTDMAEIIEIEEITGDFNEAAVLPAADSSVSTDFDISLNTVYPGTLQSTSAENWYKFTLSGAGYVSLSFSHEYIESDRNYWRAYLYNSGQEELTSYSFYGSTTSSTTGNIGLSEDTYYLKLTHGSWYATGYDYNIKINYTSSAVWEAEFNDNYNIADSISVNNVYYGSLCRDDDADWYKFTVTAAGYISLNFSHGYIESDRNYWKAYLYNSRQEELTSYSFYGSTTSSTTGNIGLPEDIYYLKIEQGSWYGTGYDYNIKINYTASNAWETEFNDSYNTADSINVNNVYYGSLCSDDDADWYKFTVPGAGYISLNFSHGYIESDRNYWKAYLYNSDPEELTSYSFYGSATSSTGGNIGLPGGTYYLKIEQGSWYSTGYDYNIKISYTASNAWETEFNDSYDTANVINVNNVYYGSLCSDDDADWYKFTLTSGGMQKLYFTHDYISSGGSYWRLYLYNSSMEELFDCSYEGDTTEYSHSLNLSKGTYYLKITDASWDAVGYDYNLKLSPHIHSYNAVVTRATTSENGRIVQTCSCGATNGTTIIYYPKTISLSAASYKYNGKVKKPSVKVTGSDGKTIAPANYTVSYAGGRKNVGTYKVSISFKGNYGGTVTRTFTIVPQATSISRLIAKSKGFTVKWKKRTGQVTGYQIQYSVNKNFRNMSVRTISGNSAASVSYKGLKAKKKYYVRIRTYKNVSGTKYYSAWSAVKSVTTKK